MKKYNVFLFCFLGCFLYSYSQFTNMNWKQYNLSFQVPINAVVQESSDVEYAANTDYLTISILPYKNATISANDVANQAYTSVNATGKVIESDEKIVLNGFEGYRIIGSGYQNGKKLRFYCLGMIDPDSDINFKLFIYYWDDITYNAQCSRDANKIISSIKKMARASGPKVESQYSTSNYTQQNYSTTGNWNNSYGQAPKPCGMDVSDFTAAVTSIKSKNYDSYRLDAAKQIAASNSLSAEQIKTIMKQFEYDSYKLDFAKYAYEYTCDKKNYWKCNDAFTYESYGADLKKHIEK